MARIDPNRYVDSVPLTPRQIIERIGLLDDASAGFERRRDAITKDKKELVDKIKSNDEARRDMLRCHRMGRCVYLLTDGTITTEPPSGLALWDAAKAGQAAERSQAEAASYVAPIFELFGVGRPKADCFTRTLADGKSVLVQTEKAGEWIAARGVKGGAWEVLEGGPWRSCADAMLAVLASVEWKGEAKDEVDGWTAIKSPKTIALVTAPAPTKAAKAKGQPDDGTIYRGTFGERSLAVAQVAAPGPWSAYVDQKSIAPANVGKTGTAFESSEAAKEAVREYLKAKDLTWLGSKGQIAPPQPTAGGVPAAPVDAPKRRTRAQ